MYRKIFVAIDESQTSNLALAEAIQLAKTQGAELVIGHAADEALLSQHGMGIGTYINVDATRQAIRDYAENLLATARQTATDAGVPATTCFLEGTHRISEQIAEGAKATGADLIVIGTHGRRGLDRLVMGSVAEQLVRIAPLSLLLVRQH